MKVEIKRKIKQEFKSYAELARWIGVTRQIVSIWMLDKQRMSVKHALKLAKRLKVHWLDIREDLK